MPSAHASLLSFGFFQSFVASGIIYGWPGLVLILKADGMYAPLCAPPAAAGDSNHTGSQTSAGGCAAQTAALTDLFNVAQATVTGAMVVNGSLLDRFGPRRVSSLGSSLCALGALLFALLPPPQPEDLVDMSYVAFCIMAVGGSGVHLSWFHVSNLYPESRQTISSIIIAGFVGSGAVFPVYQLLSDAAPDNFARKQIFLFHGIIVACTVPFAWRLWPEAPYAPGDSVRFTRWTLAYEIIPAAAAEPMKMQQQEQEADVIEPVDGSIATATKTMEVSIPECEMGVAQQLRQPSFWCMQTFFCIHFFRYVWLLGTLLEQFEAKEFAGATGPDAQTARVYTKITGWALPAAALLQPCIGMLLDRFGFARGFLFVVVCGTVSSALSRSSSADRTLTVKIADAIVAVSAIDDHLGIRRVDPGGVFTSTDSHGAIQSDAQ